MAYRTLGYPTLGKRIYKTWRTFSKCWDIQCGKIVTFTIFPTTVPKDDANESFFPPGS
ncbi:hypothetical protein K435DRAFT_881034 [Dendrothele bispora CBS 962.96]|uniref:Uncharacterized protein n=1 Tax=Dendrothele bispora (strain CBS 962.96) TaxID=1314807 RepID=A0A4S8KJR4_DENBC|nr:hypothetical protein K435DRAFT_881034 [Dendrothele bispora CBS 962.96]